MRVRSSRSVFGRYSTGLSRGRSRPGHAFGIFRVSIRRFEGNSDPFTCPNESEATRGKRRFGEVAMWTFWFAFPGLRRLGVAKGCRQRPPFAAFGTHSRSGSRVRRFTQVDPQQW